MMDICMEEMNKDIGDFDMSNPDDQSQIAEQPDLLDVSHIPDIPSPPDGASGASGAAGDLGAADSRLVFHEATPKYSSKLRETDGKYQQDEIADFEEKHAELERKI